MSNKSSCRRAHTHTHTAECMIPSRITCGGDHSNPVSVSLQGFGLSQLSEGASSHSLRSILCALTLLFYHTYVSLILGKRAQVRLRPPPIDGARFRLSWMTFWPRLTVLMWCLVRDRRGEPGGGRSSAGAVPTQIPQSKPTTHTTGQKTDSVSWFKKLEMKMSTVMKYFQICVCVLFQGSIILFYSARIAALRGNFEKVWSSFSHFLTFLTCCNFQTTSSVERNKADVLNRRPPSLHLSFLLLWSWPRATSGPGELRGVHQQPAGVEADPPRVLLGADVDSLVPAGMAAGVPVRWPAVQGEPLVQGERSPHDFYWAFIPCPNGEEDTFFCRLYYHVFVFLMWNELLLLSQGVG